MASTTRPGFSASRAEAKSDTTTKVARAIIAAEDAARRAKTEKLRLARLAKEAEAADDQEKPKPRASRN